MNTQEQKRMMVLNRILAGQLSAAEAASLLKLSPRQMQRILAAYRKEGVAAVVHGNRDRKPKHTIGEEVRQQVIALARGPYAGCNQQHLRDLLAEREGIVLSRASVHRILAGAQLLPDPKRGKPVHRRRRQRYAQEGMLVQIDGSRHQWLEDRGPWLTLIAAIDDATGKISAAIFREQEDAQGYFLLVRQLVERYGCPLAFYHDRHSIFLQSRKATEADSLQEQLAGSQEPTQFARLLQELAITSIAARSRAGPKGAWSDSLAPYKIGWWSNCAWQEPAPYSLANEVVQAYLPRFNAQFAIEATKPVLAYRPLPQSVNAETVFCFKYMRTVALDNTVSLGGQCVQLLPGKERHTYARTQVEVHERFDGSLAVSYGTHCVATTPTLPQTPVLRARNGRRATPQATSLQAERTLDETARQRTSGGERDQTATTRTRPAADHPWRKPLLPRKQTQARVRNG